MARSNSNTNNSYAGDNWIIQGSTSYTNGSHRSPFGNDQYYTSVTSRHSYPSITTSYNESGMNDQLYMPYSQTSKYMLPAQDQPSSDRSSTHDMPRRWTPITGNKPSTLSFEHDPLYAYVRSGFSLTNSSSTSRMRPNDSLFLDINFLSRGLPQYRDYTLANPTRKPILLEAGSDSYRSSMDFSFYCLLPALSHKGSVAFGLQTQTCRGSQGCLSSNYFGALSGSVNGTSVDLLANLL